MKFKKSHLVFILLIAFISILIFNDKVWYAIIALIIYVSIKELITFFTENNLTEIKDLKQENKRAAEEIEELKSRRLNVTDIKHIIDLSLIEIDTTFTRTFNEEFELGKDEKMRFIGALRVDIKAKYGIDLSELMFYFPEGKNVIQVGNFNPKFLAFSSRKFKWEISEILAHKKSIFKSEHWRSDVNTKSLISKITEEKRMQVENEVDKGPQELNWIKDALTKQIKSDLEFIIENHDRNIEFIEVTDERFINFYQLKELNK